MPYRLIRILRIFVAAMILALMAVGLTFPLSRVGAIARICHSMQIETAVITYSLGTFIAWLIITLVFGRIYCSTLCPLGSTMDVSSATARRVSHRVRRLRYVAPSTRLRYFFLLTLVVSLIFMSAAAVSVLLPASLFARICHRLFAPLAAWTAQMLQSIGVTVAPWFATHVVASVAGSIIATALFFAIIWVASGRGRRICNTICPIGTALGMVSRYSIFQFDIDTDLCTQCRKCVDVCKSECIDLESHVVDSSRCVVCFNCTAVCRDKAMRYTTSRKQLSIPMMQNIADMASDSGASGTQTCNPSQRNETVS